MNVSSLSNLLGSIGILLCLTCGLPISSSGQDAEATATDVDAVTHDELRAVRDRMFAAYDARDMDTLLKDVAEDVVVTWQNGDRNLGHEQVVEFYDRMMNGDTPIVKDVSSILEVDDLSLLYDDDTAISHGTLQDTFSLTDGSEFTLESKWTATVVKENNAWKVASFHVSSNIFDNPILGLAESWLAKVGIGAGIIGLVAGFAVGRVTKRAA